jgi:hypothetical protein
VYPADTTTPNFGGRLFVDSTFKYDPVEDTLCTGVPAECPDQKLHVFICTGFDTASCINAEANSFCHRLDASMPTPAP